MPVHRRVEVSEVGEVTVVRFIDRKILDTASIQELGEELFSLVEKDSRTSMVLDFTPVEFLSSAALNKLILLDRAVKKAGGQLKLCSLRPEIQEVFLITRLNQMFDIRENEAEAVAAF
jgi:anti-sigma B factor antagonist